MLVLGWASTSQHWSQCQAGGWPVLQQNEVLLQDKGKNWVEDGRIGPEREVDKVAASIAVFEPSLEQVAQYGPP